MFWSLLKVKEGQGYEDVKGAGRFVLSEKVSALISMASGVTGTSYEATMKAIFA